MAQVLAPTNSLGSSRRAARPGGCMRAWRDQCFAPPLHERARQEGSRVNGEANSRAGAGGAGATRRATRRTPSRASLVWPSRGGRSRERREESGAPYGPLLFCCGARREGPLGRAMDVRGGREKEKLYVGWSKGLTEVVSGSAGRAPSFRRDGGFWRRQSGRQRRRQRRRWRGEQRRDQNPHACPQRIVTHHPSTHAHNPHPIQHQGASRESESTFEASKFFVARARAYHTHTLESTHGARGSVASRRSSLGTSKRRRARRRTTRQQGRDARTRVSTGRRPGRVLCSCLCFCSPFSSSGKRARLFSRLAAASTAWCCHTPKTPTAALGP